MYAVHFGFANPEMVMATGTVKWFNAEEGFGFIAPDDGGADVFASYSSISSSGYRSLDENQRVEFDVTRGPRGLQAKNIHAVGPLEGPGAGGGSERPAPTK